ncbi:MAG: ketoacyl-ACP synthase III [Planctomycetes bacterium]|nr:ketoacyl-ACP synthase III [Planctomycetota bacterium]
MLRSRIAGVGGYVPPHLVRNEDLEGPMEISAEAITRRTGIRQRYWADRDPRLATSDLALQASLRALEHAQLPKDALDLIVVATLSPDAAAPATACFLQEKLDLPGIPAFDVRAQCSGFLYGLEIADLYIRAGVHKHVLLVGAELQSKLLDMTPRGRNVTVLFGDGAGAVVLSAAEVADTSTRSKESFLYSTHLHSDGALLGHLLWQHPGTMNRKFVTPELVHASESHPQMKGRELYDICMQRMPEVSRAALAAHGFQVRDVDLFVIHQSNLRINHDYADVMGVPRERVFSTIERFGNTTAATIPLGLSEAVREGVLKPGMLVLSCSFGSGITWGAALYRW